MSTLPKTWSTDVVSDYIKQESQQKSPDVFLETHLPIRKIRAKSLVGYDGDFVSDEELFEHVVQSDPSDAENRIYLLKGEVGSGKSHLCQWLEYQINGDGDQEGADDHVAIHISRNNTRLSDILDKLYEHIDAEYDDLQDIATLDAEDLADFIISGLRTFEANKQQFETFDLEAFIEDTDADIDLRTVLERNIREYQEAVEAEDREQRIELITREEFGRICFNVFGNTHSDSDIFPAVRNAIHERLMTNVGIEDFQGELVDIADQYQREGKRPVLICEDVTTFTVLKDDLMDHIFQLGDGGEQIQSGFDVILGYTTGWETEKADDALMTGDLSYMRQRAVGYLQMTNEEGEAYFLEDGAMPVQLVRKYLNVIKEHSDVSEAVDEDAFEELYPFNERFVMRAYKHLEENGTLQQTPRLLLYHVIGDCLRSDVPPHKKIEGNSYVRDVSAPVSVGNYDASFLGLVKWYGKMEDGNVVVPEAYFEAFDVEIPDGVSIENRHVTLGVRYRNIGWAVPESDLRPIDPTDSTDETFEFEDEPDDEDEDEDDDALFEGGSSGISGNESTDPDEQSRRAERIDEFQRWFGSGGEFPSANRLREGVQAALTTFHEPTRLANENATTRGTAGFYYARGDDVPVEIRGPDSSKDRAITVDHKSDEVADYEMLLYELMRYGLEDEFDDRANFDAMRSWTDDKVVEFRAAMRTDLESCIPEGMTLEEFLVLARFLLLNGAHGTMGLSKGLLLRDPDEYELDETSPFTWDESPFEIPRSLKDGFSEMTKRRAEVADLCHGFFLLKENFVDHERLDPALESVSENLEEYIRATASMSASDVPDAYRIGTTRSGARTRVQKLFEVVSDYANELQKLEQSFEAEELWEDVGTVSDLYSQRHTAEDLGEMYERLETSIQPLDANLSERWERAETLLTETPEDLDLVAFGNALNSFEDVDPDSGIEVMALMYEYNESRAEHDAWLVYETLAEMIEAIEDHDDADVSEFQDLVRDESAFATFQQRRDAVVDTIGGI